MGKARTLVTQADTSKIAPLSQGMTFLKSLISSPSANAKSKAIAEAATDFQRRVWAACACVPEGKVTTYGDIAKMIGCPGSARAVGQALSKNPFAPTIPCHRVVGSNRFLTGFSGERFVSGGVESEKKIKRLSAERVKVDVKSGKVLPENMISF